MKYSIAALAAGALLVTGMNVQADQERPEVGRYVQAYSGDFNSSVFVVRLGAADQAEALVLISGIDSDLDGKVLKTSIQVRDENRRSLMVREGDENRELIRLEGTGGHLFVSTAPLGPTHYALSYDGKLSQGAEAQHILTRWLQDR